MRRGSHPGKPCRNRRCPVPLPGKTVRFKGAEAKNSLGNQMGRLLCVVIWAPQAGGHSRVERGIQVSSRVSTSLGKSCGEREKNVALIACRGTRRPRSGSPFSGHLWRGTGPCPLPDLSLPLLPGHPGHTMLLLRMSRRGQAVERVRQGGGSQWWREQVAGTVGPGWGLREK